MRLHGIEMRYGAHEHMGIARSGMVWEDLVARDNLCMHGWSFDEDSWKRV